MRGKGVFSPELLARIRREVGRVAPAHQVDDLSQEACVRIIEKERLWRPERGTVSRWAAAVARNVAKNRLRADRLEAGARDALMTRAYRDADAVDDERIAVVLEQFARLPDDEQQLLRWRYLESRTVTEIADELGVSQPSATRRIQGALASLRQRARAHWLSIPAVLQTFGAHKMKLAVAASLAAFVAVAEPSWFLPDRGAAVVAKTTDLEATGVAASLSQKLDPDRNLLWAASAPLAWIELKSLLGGDVRLDTEPEEVAGLNASPFSKDDVAASSYVSGAGIIGDGIVARLQAQLHQKFRKGPDPVLARLARSAGKGHLITYAFLHKAFKWKCPYEQLKKPVTFHWKDGEEARTTDVKAFGISKFDYKKQVHIDLYSYIRLWHAKDGRFAVELRNPDTNDRVVLAMVPPAETLGATVDRALAFTKAKGQRLRPPDTLQIPVLDFDITHEFKRIRGTVQNDKHRGKPIASALQTIRFRLDHKGVELRTRFGAVGAKARPTPPRELIFDRPYLVLLQEGQAKRPYLAAWMAQPELMTRVE